MAFRSYQASELPGKYLAWLKEYGVTEDMPLDRVFELAVKVRLRRLASGAPRVPCKTKGLRGQTDIQALTDLIDLLRPVYARAKACRITEERDEIAARHEALERIRPPMQMAASKRLGQQPRKARKYPLSAG